MGIVLGRRAGHGSRQNLVRDDYADYLALDRTGRHRGQGRRQRIEFQDGLGADSTGNRVAHGGDISIVEQNLIRSA